MKESMAIKEFDVLRNNLREASQWKYEIRGGYRGWRFFLWGSSCMFLE